MITLTAKINLLGGERDNGEIWVADENVEFRKNNISATVNDITGTKKRGSNPFILGSSKLGSGATFSNGVDYFISRHLSDDNGNFEQNRILLYDDSESIKTLTFSFDTVNNRHPKSIMIDGIEYKDDDSTFTITNLQPASQHFIEITNWNTPNSPLVITGIYVEVSIDLDYRNLISLESTIYDRSDMKLPSFGIISNTGNIEFNDINGEVRDYAEQLLLEKGLKCVIKLNNTLVDGASETVGVLETDQWNYEADNRVVSVSLKDDLEEWQDINVPAIEYDPRKLESKPFKWLYEHLHEITTKDQHYEMLSFDELDSDTKAVLEKTYTQYPLLESGSLWRQWTKLCEVCQLHIYKNNMGIVVCRYNGGN